MKRKELFWMLIPCLVLGGFGVFLRWREDQQPPLRTTGPFSWRVVKSARQALSAREVGLGYGDKWTVDLEGSGAPPPFKAGWSYAGTRVSFQNTLLINKRTGKAIKFKPPRQIQQDQQNTYPQEDKSQYGSRRLTLVFLIPHIETAEALSLQTTLGTHHAFLCKKPPIGGYDHVQGQNWPLVVQVRRADEKVPLSAVSRYCPIEIVKTSAIKVRPRGANQDVVKVEINTRCLDREWLQSHKSAWSPWQFDRPCLADDSGQYFDFAWGFGYGLSQWNPQDLSQVTGFYNFNLAPSANQAERNINQRRGRLWLVGAVSVADCWPREFRVLLRGAPNKDKGKS